MTNGLLPWDAIDTEIAEDEYKNFVESVSEITGSHVIDVSRIFTPENLADIIDVQEATTTTALPTTTAPGTRVGNFKLESVIQNLRRYFKSHTLSDRKANDTIGDINGI